MSNGVSDRISECAKCRRVFTSLSNFDAHQDVEYGRTPAVKCLDPMSVGLVLNKHGQWKSPGKGERWWDRDEEEAG